MDRSDQRGFRLRSWEQGGHVSEQISTELVPGGAIELFEVRFFVVAA
jgi:hypothetical protein